MEDEELQECRPSDEGTNETEGPQECVDPSAMGLEELESYMVRVATGEVTMSSEERTSLVNRLEGMSNDEFSTLITNLEDSGDLFSFMEALHGDQEVPENIDFEVPVFCWRFWNAEDRIQQDVDTANDIYHHEGIHVVKGSERVISKSDTETAVGHEVEENWGMNRDYETNDDGEKRYVDEDMIAILNAYVTSSVIGGVWAKRVYKTGGRLAGTSSREGSFGAGYHRLAAVSTDAAGADTFAHELGHILIDTGHRNDDENNLMHSGGHRDKDSTDDERLSEDEVNAIKSNALGWARAQECR